MCCVTRYLDWFNFPLKPHMYYIEPRVRISTITYASKSIKQSNILCWYAINTQELSLLKNWNKATSLNKLRSRHIISQVYIFQIRKVPVLPLHHCEIQFTYLLPVRTTNKSGWWISRNHQWNSTVQSKDFHVPNKLTNFPKSAFQQQ